MLWHRLTVIDPPKELLQKLEKDFVGGGGWFPLASFWNLIFASK